MRDAAADRIGATSDLQDDNLDLPLWCSALTDQALARGEDLVTALRARPTAWCEPGAGRAGRHRGAPDALTVEPADSTSREECCCKACPNRILLGQCGSDPPFGPATRGRRRRWTAQGPSTRPGIRR